MAESLLAIRLRNRAIIARRIAAVRAAKDRKALTGDPNEGLNHAELDRVLAGEPEPEPEPERGPPVHPTRHRKRYVPIDHPEQPCAICGMTYKPKQTRQKCCGPTCQARLALKRGREYRVKPEVQARCREYRKSTESKFSKDRYQARPEVQARRRAAQRRREAEARVRARVAAEGGAS